MARAFLFSARSAMDVRRQRMGAWYDCGMTVV